MLTVSLLEGTSFSPLVLIIYRLTLGFESAGVVVVLQEETLRNSTTGGRVCSKRGF